MDQGIASLVSRARRRAGVSMHALAAASDVGVATISRLESGAFDPRWSTVDALMRALGTSVDRERDRARFELEAAHRNRIGNVFPAARLAAPSYDNVELWTLLEGVTVGGKPVSEEGAAWATLSAYDRGVAAATHLQGDETVALRDAEQAFSSGLPLPEAVAVLAAELAVFTGKHLAIPDGAAISAPADAAAYGTA